MMASAVRPEVALPIIRNRASGLAQAGLSLNERALLGIVSDLLDVVAQLAAPPQSNDAWFGAWECGCTDTERTPHGIPEFCPVHGRKLICSSAGATKVQLNHSGVSGYGFKAKP